MLHGYENRTMIEDERQAYWTANIINCWVKKPITPETLLKPLHKKPKTSQERADDKEYFTKAFAWKFNQKEEEKCQL